MTFPIHPGLEGIRDGFFILDLQWRVRYWNAAAEKIFQMPRAHVAECVLWDVLPRLRGTSLWKGLHDAVQGRSSGEFPFTDDSDSPACYSVDAVLLQDADGLAVRLRDATRERERYERLLESIRDGFIAVDTEWRIVYVNHIAESLLRLPRSRAVGTLLWDWLPTQPPEIAANVRATMRDSESRHLRHVRPEGREFDGRVFDLWVDGLPGGGVSLLFEDVTRQLQREHDLAHYAAEAQDANRAKSRFFAAVSHELRTPLNAIVGYTHLLSSGAYGDVPAGAQRAAERAGVCAEHLARLVDDVLLLTTTEVGRLPIAPVPVQLDRFLPGAVEPLRHQAEAKGLHFTVEVAADTPRLTTDPDRLRQLLLAVVSNAIKFTSRGEVRIQAGPVPPTEEAAGASAVRITVSDTGPGIPAEDRERIFDPFERLGDPSRSDSMSRGTGLGLTLARQLAALLGGTLRVEPVAEEPGSVFSLRLPVGWVEGEGDPG